MLSSAYSPYSPSLPTAGQLRQPRAIVNINGFDVIWTDIHITTTTFYVADSYNVEIPLYGQHPSFDISYLSLQGVISVEIWVGFPKDPNAFSTEDLQLLIVGDCDEMVVDPLRAIVTFSGRDLTSRLIDVKTFAKYPNQTASNIVTNLANQAGLNPVVTPTQGNVGTFYVRQNTFMTKQTTQWDLITFLAQQYNFVAYVEGYNLVFAPKPNMENSTPYILTFQPPTSTNGSPISNCISLEMSRCFTVSRDVTVKVRVPYSPLTGKAFTTVIGKSNSTISTKNAGNQTYVYTYPGLTQQQALAKAQQILAEITLNEIKISAMLPGDNILKKSSLIQVVGTKTRFDQFYYTDTITRTLNVEDGYLMELNAKNQDVNSQVNL